LENSTKNSFLSRTIPVWNQLPEEIVKTNSTDSFKSKLDNFVSLFCLFPSSCAKPSLSEVRTVMVNNNNNKISSYSYTAYRI